MSRPKKMSRSPKTRDISETAAAMKKLRERDKSVQR